ncbi:MULTISPECIES: cytochrome c oxidase subunit 3 [Rubinisphaera]|uniref:Cytochrome oxidase subunit III n=1 Tax=Rubinisphaera brasiliensis (strain ATCC 49424 / DSM 5305 / JCM 21570 / IAM 15109 / NBRC 103401 / IFAM 1448) TaxID=756272 RepID=F0SPD8_RUBBR|nr:MULTISPECIES: cytochrome c oxidase subunit 3 [Rubinisphaera]ADY62246.1 cytochrome oxidase subunit III [Rubinisphaera brasiliensis DSM 5305]
MATAVDPQNESAHDDHHGDWHHKPFSAHHFENAEQQFDSGKLGMWLFLITEVLFFSGLFVAYAVYRANHPEIFLYASQYLDKYLGGLNTIVLIFSSLTMAWGVRCAQLGQRTGLIVMLGITLFCAALFLGVKTFEYTEKAHKRLLWAGAFVHANQISKSLGTADEPGDHVFVVGDPKPEATFEDRVMTSLSRISRYWIMACVIPLALFGAGYFWRKRQVITIGAAVLISFVAIIIGIQMSIAIHHAQHGSTHGEHAAAEHLEEGGTAHDAEHQTPEEKRVAEELKEAHPEHTVVAGNISDPMLTEETNQAAPAGMKSLDDKPKNANIFFSIYYFMTGLHAFHIVCGMIAISWLLVRAVEGHFRPDYFGPVDYVGLYWHVVDLIWIYLFPLLYLIGE